MLLKTVQALTLNINLKRQAKPQRLKAEFMLTVKNSSILGLSAFYPYDNPKYSIVVMREGGKSGAGDCCPVFRTIVGKN